MIFYATILFVLLSPGMLLTLPPVGRSIWRSGKTSLIAVLVHAFIFYLLLSFRRQVPVVNMIFEGFANPGDACTGDESCGDGMKCENKKCMKYAGEGEECDKPFTMCGKKDGAPMSCAASGAGQPRKCRAGGPVRR